MEPDSSEQYLPRVSIVIVNYNGSRWLELFVPHLVKTQYPDFEIIIVDNASNDDSLQYLKDNYKCIRLVLLSENKGFAEGANIGAMHSTGEVLVFLNNDMEVSYNWLMNAIPKLISDNSIAALQCKIMEYDDRHKIQCIGLSVDRYNFFHTIGFAEVDTGQYNNLEEIGACSGGAMVIWRRIFYEVGCFDNFYFMYYEDVDLSWRIRLAGYKICPATSSVVYHVGSGSSHVRSSDDWHPSPFFAYLSSRNSIYCWLKNSSSQIIIIYWPLYFLGNLLISLYLIPNVSFKAGMAYFKGFFWPFRHFPYIMQKRKIIDRIVKNRKDKILFVNGIVSESSNFLHIVKKSPSVLKRVITKR